MWEISCHSYSVNSVKAVWANLQPTVGEICGTVNFKLTVKGWWSVCHLIFVQFLWILHACSTQFYVANVTFLCIFDGFMSFFACALKSLNMPVFGETCEFCSCRWKVKNCVRRINLDRKFNIVTELFCNFFGEIWSKMKSNSGPRDIDSSSRICSESSLSISA